jgi:hypothetical protein
MIPGQLINGSLTNWIRLRPCCGEPPQVLQIRDREARHLRELPMQIRGEASEHAIAPGSVFLPIQDRATDLPPQPQKLGVGLPLHPEASGMNVALHILEGRGVIVWMRSLMTSR